MKYLFICTTPLHTYIAKAIIKLNRYNYSDCQMLYTYWEKTDKLVYFEEKTSKCFDVFYKYEVRKFPFYVFDLKSIFKNRQKYEKVFFSLNISPIIQTILSIVSFDEFYTFDDGTAYLIKDSPVYTGVKMSNFKKMMRRAFGITYDGERILHDVRGHYSIYKGLHKYRENLIEINPFRSFVIKKTELNDDSECLVILGACYNEVFSTKDCEINYIKSLNNYIKDESKNKDVYYINHPRERDSFDIIKPLSINGFDIAEFEILKLTEKYSKVFVVGLLSSVHYNLYSNDRIINVLIKNKETKAVFNKDIPFEKEVFKMVKEI